LSLVISQRLVLFYAQSGAGKSSLINTRLIPELQEEGFLVLPVGRVSGDLPEGIDQVENIFLFNLILGLDQEKGDPRRYSTLTLSEFLANLSTEDGKHFYYEEEVEEEAEEAVEDYQQPPHVLIIDQFEEIFNTHLEHWEKRAGFFEQLEQAMKDDPLLWVVLVLREDYVAALDPYAPALENRMRARLYMQRMSCDAGLEAVKKPAEKAGRPFSPGVAEWLIDNLRLIRSADGKEGADEFIVGEFVEPVQLQVVCYQLWEDLEEKSSAAITRDDLIRLAKGSDLAVFINKAIGDFYERAIARVLEEVKLSERKLRDWFSHELITEAETRGYVYQGEKRTGSLPNEAVRILEAQYIIRSEPKAGGTWIELVHDRFVGPILRANREWQALNQNPLILAAQAWKDAGEDPKLLYEGTQLERALAETKSEELPPIADEFLKRSEKTRQEKTAIRQRRITRAAILLIIVLIGLTSWAVASSFAATNNAQRANFNAVTAQAASTQASANALKAQGESTQAAAARSTSDANALAAQAASTEAHQQEAIALSAQQTAVAARDEIQLNSSLALSRGLATIALNFVEKQLDLALLLAIEAFNTHDTVEARSAILSGLQRRQALSITPLLPIFPEDRSDILSLAFTPDGEYLAWGMSSGEVVLWNIEENQVAWTAEEFPALGHSGNVTGLAFSRDGTVLASAGVDTQIIWWNVENGERIDRQSTGSNVQGLAFSPDGRQLAAAVGSEVQIWNAGNRRREAVLIGPNITRAVAWSPDARWIAAGDANGRIWIWNTEQLQERGIPLPDEHFQAITSLVWSPDPESTIPLLASGGEDRSIFLWNVETREPLFEFRSDNAGQVRSLAFSRDGRLLVSAGDDSDVIVWDTKERQIAAVLSDPQLRLNSVAFSAGGDSLLATAGFEDHIYLYKVATRQPLGNVVMELPGNTEALVFPSSEQLLAAQNAGDSISLSNVSLEGQQPEEISSIAGRARQALLSQDGNTLALAGEDGAISVQDLSSDEPATIITTLSQPTSLALSPDGNLLAFAVCGDTAADADECRIEQTYLWQIVLWDLAANQHQGTILTRHEGEITSLAFNWNAEKLASGSEDQRIYVWNVASRDQFGFALNRHTDEVLSLAFSPDGKILASGGEDIAIILWDLESGQPIGKPIFNPNGVVTSLAFNPDGTTLASGSADEFSRLGLPLNTVVSLWDVDIRSWINIACDIAERNLMEEEWDRFVHGRGRFKSTCANNDFVETTPTPTPEATPQPPAQCSVEGRDEIVNYWENQTDGQVDVYWVDYDCNEVYYYTLGPGESIGQITYRTHPWRFIDPATGEVIKSIVAENDQATITIP
jgi:WD40 repeat protein/cell division protein FtsB